MIFYNNLYTIDNRKNLVPPLCIIICFAPLYIELLLENNISIPVPTYKLKWSFFQSESYDIRLGFRIIASTSIFLNRSIS